MTSIKRLRIFAGPNGSGKSTLVKVVNALHVHLGVFVNADELKTELDRHNFLDFTQYTLRLDIKHLTTR
jgi:predicted ABC-type ATPase